MRTSAEDPYPEVRRWDPYATFSIINPDRDAFTCVGYAPSRRRRCQNPVNRYNQELVYDLLDQISSLPPSSEEVAKLLPRLASLSLCPRWHGDQIDSVAKQWAMRISTTHSPSLPRGGQKVKTEKEQRWKIFEETGASSHHSFFNDEDQIPHHKSEQHRRRKEQQHREWRETEERKRREMARRQREEAREHAVRERREWQQAWQSYVTKWAAFKESKTTTTTPSDLQQAQQRIPWPTKSGRFGDLTNSSVMTFYQKACPDADTPAMCKIMKAESLKWHPDKMSRLYPPSCEPGDLDKKNVLMICRVVLELKEQADEVRAR